MRPGGRYRNHINGYQQAGTVRDAAIFDYGQWELPFEAVLVAVMEKPRNQVKFDFNRAAVLAEAANIVIERVLDPATWQKFLSWNETQ